MYQTKCKKKKKELKHYQTEILQWIIIKKKYRCSQGTRFLKTNHSSLFLGCFSDVFLLLWISSNRIFTSNNLINAFIHGGWSCPLSRGTRGAGPHALPATPNEVNLRKVDVVLSRAQVTQLGGSFPFPQQKHGKNTLLCTVVPTRSTSSVYQVG